MSVDTLPLNKDNCFIYPRLDARPAAAFSATERTAWGAAASLVAAVWAVVTAGLRACHICDSLTVVYTVDPAQRRVRTMIDGVSAAARWTSDSGGVTAAGTKPAPCWGGRNGPPVRFLA